MFDIAVNMGVATSAKTLQNALNLMNRNQSFPDLKLTETPGKDNAIVNKEILFKVLNGLQFTMFQ
jgi:hypothetical protein